MSAQKNQILDNSAIFIAIFITQLTAIIAQGSLRASLMELAIQILIWGALLGFSLYFGWSYIHKDDENPLPTQLTNGAAMIGMAAFFYQIVTNNLTSAILLMLAWLLIALSFSFKRQRNLYFSLVASMALLLYAASISKSSGFISYIVIYTLAAIIALAGNFYLGKMKQQVKLVEGNTGFPFKMPITLVAGLVLLITAGIYLLAPRPTPLNWGVFPAGGGRYYAEGSWPKTEKTGEGADNADDAYTKAMKKMKQSGVDTEALEKQLKDSGLKDKLKDLEKQTNQIRTRMDKKRDSKAFHYSGFKNKMKLYDQQTKQKDGSDSYKGLVLYMEGKEPQYLRGKIFDHFDGISWKTTKQVKKRIDRKENKFTLNRPLKGDFELYTVTLAIDLAGEPSIYVPSSTAEIQFPGNAIAKDNYGALFSPQQIDKDTFYSMKVKTKGNRINGRPVDNANKPTRQALKRYTQLPKDLSERFFSFSKKISANSSSVLEKASKIESYLRKNYTYSAESIHSSQGKIPLEKFLFKEPKGHCEYFATAMVTLMRAQKIPARLVTGFSVTTFNPVTGYYEARGLDAHAWAEVWVPQAGWVTFEATPPYNLPKPSKAENTSQSIEEYLRARANNADLTEPESFTTTMIHIAKRTFEQLNMLFAKTWRGLKAAVVWTGSTLLHWGWLVALLAAAVFSAVHYLRYYLTHRRVKKTLQQLKKKPLQQQLEVGFIEMEKVFALYQLPRQKEWTLHQYKFYISEVYPGLEREVMQVSDALNQCLYQQGACQQSSSALSKQVAEAMKNIKTVNEYRFVTPIPAEKQINAVKKFINTFSIDNLKRSLQDHYG